MGCLEGTIAVITTGGGGIADEIGRDMNQIMNW